MLRAAARLLMPSSSMGYTIPHDDWFAWVRESSRYSPDIAKIEQYSHQLYFSCDETQAGHWKNTLIEGAEYKFPGFTQQSFNYWNTDIPIYPPVAMPAKGFKNIMPGSPPIAKIKGQIFKITAEQLLALDIYKENTVQFTRERIRVIVPHRAIKWVKDRSIPDPEVEWYSEQGSMALTKERVCILRAWMYYGKREFWDPLINNYEFRSVSTHQSNQRPWCQEYYRLAKPE